MFRQLTFLLFVVFISSNASLVIAKEPLPDDIRYFLEDLYGSDTKKWPSPQYKRDLNEDGFSDWVAIKNNCKLKNNCPAEIFVCVPNEKGACKEYCYMEVKTLINIKENVKTLKCESTC